MQARDQPKDEKTAGALPPTAYISHPQGPLPPSKHTHTQHTYTHARRNRAAHMKEQQVLCAQQRMTRPHPHPHTRTPTHTSIHNIQHTHTRRHRAAHLRGQQVLCARPLIRCRGVVAALGVMRLPALQSPPQEAVGDVHAAWTTRQGRTASGPCGYKHAQALAADARGAELCQKGSAACREAPRRMRAEAAQKCKKHALRKKHTQRKSTRCERGTRSVHARASRQQGWQGWGL